MFSFDSFKNGWNRFFYDETDPSMLCAFRICLGFFLFLNGISLIPDFEAWFGIGTNSLVPLQDSLGFYSNFRINFFKWLSPTETSAWLVLITYTLSSFFLMIGFKTRISGIVAFILMISLQNRNYVILNSGDTIMRCMLFLLMLSPCQVKYSVDAWLRKKNGSLIPEKIPVTFIRLMQLQFTLVYLATTLFKLKGYDWVDGTAVYYTSRLENFQRLAVPILFDYALPNKWMTWSALFIEFSMGTLIWVKEWRKWVLLAGLTLHLGIEVTMSIGFFEWVMVSAYILFLEKSEFDRILRPVQKTWHRVRSSVSKKIQA
jgi:uncharacterized membrane protein YphA (DoxX/SURF4 family)